jgi:hypothetical protein
VVTGGWLEIKNYGWGRLCREGLWFGWRSLFQETVVLSYEHDPEDLYVGWQINGATVIDPGYSSGTPPFGWPSPGEPSVRYRCPEAGYFHRLALVSTAGEPPHCLNVQVLYRTPTGPGAPPTFGPSMWVCLSGYEITWPAAKLEEYRKCMRRLRELLERYVKIAHVGPGDPVEHWLDHLEDDEALRVGGMIEALESLDPKADAQILEAIKTELTGLVRWAESPGSRLSGGLSERASAERPTAESADADPEISAPNEDPSAK